MRYGLHQRRILLHLNISNYFAMSTGGYKLNKGNVKEFRILKQEVFITYLREKGTIELCCIGLLHAISFFLLTKIEHIFQQTEIHISKGSFARGM